MYLETLQTLHGKFWQWLKDQIAQDVPEEDGLCEYDCRKQQCTEEEVGDLRAANPRSCRRIMA
jgi:hypothetical protein